MQKIVILLSLSIFLHFSCESQEANNVIIKITNSGMSFEIVTQLKIKIDEISIYQYNIDKKRELIQLYNINDNKISKNKSIVLDKNITKYLIGDTKYQFNRLYEYTIKASSGSIYGNFFIIDPDQIDSVGEIIFSDKLVKLRVLSWFHVNLGI